MLKSSVPALDKDSALVQFFIDYKDVWFGPVMFVFLGALITIIIQSSSAAMTLTMTLVAAGLIPFEVAAAMVLGENIGTTITAELASTVGNVYAKRSARIHSLFNVIGVTWMLIVFPFFVDFVGGLVGIDVGSSKELSELEKENLNTGLALFHTLFNAINVTVLIWFIPLLVRFAERTVPSKGGEDEKFHLDYIGTGVLATPELSIQEAKKEVAKFGEITARMNSFVDKLLWTSKDKEKDYLHEKIRKYEDITDKVEVEVTNFLSKISQSEMSEESSIRIRGMMSITNDLERIGDIYYQMSKAIERKDKEKLWISPEQRQNLKQMGKLVDKAFEIMIANLQKPKKDLDLDAAERQEKEINECRDKLRSEQFNQMDGQNYNSKSGIIYNDLFSSLEKVGDHIINVSQALAGRV